MLQKVLTYDWRSTSFCFLATCLYGFDQTKAAKIALKKPFFCWLYCCTYENSNYEIYKDMMPTVYFPVSKINLTDIYMKENSNNYCVVNKKNLKTQNLSGWKIYPTTESPGER